MKPVTYAELDLNAVQHNLARAKESAPNAKIMAVIKANGYGHGLLRIANALANNVEALAVARVDEAIRLRQAGVTHRIAVLEGFVTSEELDAFVDYNLEAMLHCDEQLTLLANRAGQGKLTVWLKMDSGMNRLGFKETDFATAYQRLQSCSNVNNINFLTHLANADDMQDLKTLEQIRLFKQMVKNYSGECSIANSAGLLFWEQALSDWVRPGIMLYGISPFAQKTAKELRLKPVMSLYSRLIAVKSLNKGETVGYSGTFVAEKNMRLGVVAIGYGDGYPRHTKSGTPVLINGQRVPLVGRVSMDMLTVDLSLLADAKVGDTVTLWGKGLPIEEIAECANTIPYTLVCGVTQRVSMLEKSNSH